MKGANPFDLAYFALLFLAIAAFAVDLVTVGQAFQFLGMAVALVTVIRMATIAIDARRRGASEGR